MVETRSLRPTPRGKRHFRLFLTSLFLLACVFWIPADAADYEVVLNIVSINDLHGEADPAPDKNFPGLARVVGAIGQLEADYPGRNIVVSAGDNYTETVISYVTQGKIVDDGFKKVNVLYSAVGNHEFDWILTDPKLFAAWESQGNFRYLAANIRNKNTGADAYKFTPYGTAEANGVKVGFIGAITDEMPLITSDTLKAQYEFTATADIPWRQYADELRAQSCDVVIALTHNGTDQAADGTITGEVVDAAAKGVFDPVDGILSAHSHRKVSGLIDSGKGKLPVVQGRKGGDYLSILQLRKLPDGSREIAPLLVHVQEAAEDTETKQMVADYNARYKSVIEKPITTLEARLEGTPAVAAWGCDSLVACALQRTGEKYIVVQNTGGFRTDYMNSGTVTYGDMYRMLPYENKIVTMNFRGEDLVALLKAGDARESKGLTYSGVKKSGDIYVLAEDGKTIDPQADYAVLTNDFLAAGGDGYDMSKAKDKEEWPDITREALCTYFARQSDDNYSDSSSGCMATGAQALPLCAALVVLMPLLRRRVLRRK